MFSNKHKKNRIDAEAREQYEYARKRVNQKKGLMRHFIFFLAGSILFIILDAGLSMGHQLLMPNWFVWAIVIWAFILLVHLFNVFIMNTFMGAAWEDKQLEQLKAKQEERIAKLEKEVIRDITIQKVKVLKATETQTNKNENPNQLPPDHL